MDAVFPALIGLGLWFCYEAWQSGKSKTAPHPVAKVTSALRGTPYSDTGSTPTGNAPYTGKINPQTGLPQGVTVGAGGAIHP